MCKGKEVSEGNLGFPLYVHPAAVADGVISARLYRRGELQILLVRLLAGSETARAAAVRGELAHERIGRGFHFLGRALPDDHAVGDEVP